MVVQGRVGTSQGSILLLQMSSAAENGDAAPGKQNEEKTYKKVSDSFVFFLPLREREHFHCLEC